MKTYTARIIFGIDIEGATHQQYDEQLVLLSADTAGQAFAKIEQKGLEERETFVNAHGHMVHWRFLGVAEFDEVNIPTEAVSIASRTVISLRGSVFAEKTLDNIAQLRQRMLSQLGPAAFG